MRKGEEMADWRIYTGSDTAHDGIAALPDPPSWRRFDGAPVLPDPPASNASSLRRLGSANREFPRTPDENELNMVNAALYLRRPLLVTGEPGTGKSTLAHDIARELRLGAVLQWPITSRSTLHQGLYRYDPIARIRDEGLHGPKAKVDIGRYLSLGPLGTALLPFARPRVLLIDEFDKCDLDLPNDLLNVFEDGEFIIDELQRVAREQPEVEVMTADQGRTAPVREGLVRCRAFPLVVLTSNGDRDFPPAFLRRCLRLRLERPTDDQIAAVVERHLGTEAAVGAEELIGEFTDRRDNRQVNLSMDQLLNAVYLRLSAGHEVDEQMRNTIEKVFADLNETAP